MSEKQPAEGPPPRAGRGIAGVKYWRRSTTAFFAPVFPKILSRSRESGDELVIAVDSEFKKEYCLRKQAKLEEIVARVMGPRRLVIGEPPLIEKAREVRPRVETSGRIGVLGIGDGGVNAIDRMREEHLQGVRLVAVDTDKQVLGMSRAHELLQLGADITGGRGTGGDETKGRQAAQESRWEIASLLKGMDLVFVTAGLGGGTGTGAAPVVAEIARENGALTIGVVTRPFAFEGTVRRARAEAGLAKLREAADVLIVISNDRLLETAAKGLPLTKAFELADGILHQGVRGISDLITVRGLVNLDFSDIRNILSGAGEAMMGMGEARGEQRGPQRREARQLEPSPGGRVDPRRAEADHEHHRRGGPHPERGDGGCRPDSPRGGDGVRPGVRRGGEGRVQGRGEDHRHRGRLRGVERRRVEEEAASTA